MPIETTVTSRNTTISDLMCGFVEDKGSGELWCLYCGARFEKDIVYPADGNLLLARAAARRHLADAHGGPFAALMEATKDGSSGLTEIQRAIVAAVYEGKSDREIASALGGKSESTVRNHRFNLRRREFEAKFFLALTGMTEGKEKPGSAFIEYHAALPVSDDRVVVDEEEAAKIEAKYLGNREDGGLVLKNFPKKQKEKLVILRRLAELFDRGKTSTEPEVNAILSPVWDDHVTLRRYLIEYRFLDRKPDGSAYWRT
jgi:hypothetical protein